MEDMTDKAIAWIGQQQALIPDKPFFVYFAPGAAMRRTTSPRVGRQVQGKVRQGLGQRYGRRPSPGRRSWASFPRTASSRPGTRRFQLGMRCRKISSRFSGARWRSMRGSSSYTDHHIGRLFDALTKLGVFENTLCTTFSATTARRPKAR
jgi:arylsulfatase